MDPRHSQRIVPSNAPALTETSTTKAPCPNEPLDFGSVGICSDFNQGRHCRVCGLHHICSSCGQNSHGAFECKASVSRPSTENFGSTHTEVTRVGTDQSTKREVVARAPLISTRPRYHTAQADLRLQRRRHREDNIWCPWERYCPSYMRYRERVNQKKHGEEAVWPDDVEQAFQVGLYYLVRSTCSADYNSPSLETILQERTDQGLARYAAPKEQTEWRQRIHC